MRSVKLSHGTEQPPALSKRMFARVVGISNSHLRSIESGSVSPTLVTICKIASTLDEEPSKLVDEACELAKCSTRSVVELWAMTNQANLIAETR